MKTTYIIGILFSIILGTLLHFTYEWSNYNPLIGKISAVNESTWEHLKLVFYPILFFAIYEYFAYGRSIGSFIPIKVLSILIAMLTIVIIFYLYTGILGKNFFVADILIFVLAILASYGFSYKLLKMKITFLTTSIANITSILLLTVLLLGFIYFTNNPPTLALFDNPTI